MHLSQRRLLGLPVRTRGGVLLGKLTDLILDSDTGRLAFLVIRSRALIPGLGEELRISWSQVLSMSEKEIVVTDGTVPIGGTRLAIETTPPPIHQKKLEM